MAKTVYNPTICVGIMAMFVASHFHQVLTSRQYEVTFVKNTDSFSTVQDGGEGRLGKFDVPMKTDGKTQVSAKTKREFLPERHFHVESNGELEPKKSSFSQHGHKTKTKIWQALKRSIQRRNFASGGPYEFVELPKSERGKDQISLAVKQREDGADSMQAVMLGVAGTAVLIVVIVACLHMPCYCLKNRYKHDIDLDLLTCPNPTVHDGKCGKCLFDRASRKLARKSKFAGRASPVSMGTNEDLFLASESMYSVQPPWMEDFGMGSTAELQTKPKNKSRSIVQTILNRSRSRDKFRYEFLAAKYGYNYKQFGHPESTKRNSIYDEHEPDWYSAGEFLNKQSRYRAQRSYGSTTDAARSCTPGCWKFSREPSKPTNQSVEDIMKSKPRRRQVVELQEFPLGFSENYAGVKIKNCEDKEVVFDPCQESQMNRSKSGPCRHSESNLDSYFSQFDKEVQKRHSVDSGRSNRKGSLKTEGDSPRSSPKLVHFYPSSFNYETSFVQGSGMGKHRCARHRKLMDKDVDQQLSEETTSSGDSWSFGEDEDQQDGLFDYSPHMVHYRQCQNPYQKHLDGFSGYAEMPQYTYYINPQTKMRRTVRSESELRRARETPFVARRRPLRTKRHVTSSDTTLNRTHILKELTAVGLAKPCRKKAAKPSRDARIDPLVGKVSPMIRTKGIAKGKPAQERSTVVQMPGNSCKEVLLKEYDVEKANISRKLEALDFEHERADEGSCLDYKHIATDLEPPKYLKTSHLRDEPVRDTDSDGTAEGHNISVSTCSTSMTYQPSVVHCRETDIEDLLVTPQQTSS